MENTNLFHTFLDEAKNNLKTDKSKWLVLGNESSDLDSVVCSLAYSYYKQLKLCESFCVIPVISIPKKNIHLKNDVIAWLKVFNIDPFIQLIFLEDILMLMNDLEFCQNIKITLVDHHKPLNGTFAKYVKEVIDHREVLFEYPSDQLEVNNMQIVGSCSTIIASYLIADEQLCCRNILLKLLYGAILLDTDCLLARNGKTTDNDIQMVEKIEEILVYTKEYRSDIYNLLRTAKSDVSGLSLTEKIQRDLKTIEVEWRDSSIKISIPVLIETDVQDILSLDDIEQQLLVILSELEANVFIMLTCGRRSVQRRGYLICTQNVELKEKISKYLFCDSKLKLERVECNLQTRIPSFVENSLQTTRKIFIPIIENFFIQESAIHYKFQSNNCNIHLHLQEIENFEGDEAEREGAPYTLSTPRRSFAGSPDARNSDISLRSLNNRHTLELVDQKRQKHNIDVDAIDDENDDNYRHLEDDVSPLAFTPENTDEENNDSNDDLIGPLPSLDSKNLMEKNKTKQIDSSYNTVNDSRNPSNTSGNQLPLSPRISISQTEGNKHFKIKETDNWNEQLNYLENEVDKKRKKLETSRFDSIANVLVKDIITKSEINFKNEIFYKEVLSTWSDSYSEKEKLEFIKNIESGDMPNLAKLLTGGIIRDCLSEFDLVSLDSNKESNNNAITKDIDDEQAESQDNESIASEENSASFLPDSTIPDLEINYNSCPLTTIINKDNPCAVNCVNTSGVDVENSSFNLYRRISKNQLDFSEDEKRLFTIAGNWCPDDDVIYSDCEKESNPVLDNEAEIDIVKKIIYPNKEIAMNIKL